MDDKKPEPHTLQLVTGPARDRPFTARLPGGGTISGPDEASVKEALASMDDARERRARWPSDGRAAMSKLALSFPSLGRAPGADPWDADAFLRWLSSTGLSHGEQLAARFVLGVWNPANKWTELATEDKFPFPENAARFDLFEALGVWDRAHIAAVLAWIDAPFWP